MCRRPRLRFLVCLIALLTCLPLSIASSGDLKAVVIQQKSGTQAMLMGLYFRSPLLGWSVGAGGTILKTADGGKKWKRVTSGTGSLLTAVFFIDDRRGWVVGANGTVRQSTDGGENWRPIPVGTQSPLYGVFFISPQQGWIVGGAGTILHTTDGGETWLPAVG